MSFIRFAGLEEIPPGNNKSRRIGLRHIAVFNVAGSYYAIEDACSHMKAPLSGGRMRGTELTCSRHGWRYDIITGRRVDAPEGCVRTFPVKVESDAVYVDAASPTAGPCDVTEEEAVDDLPPLL